MTEEEKLSDPVRLQAVRDSRLLDSPSEPDFERLARLAAQLLGTPAAFVTVISDERQLIKSAVENGEPSALTGVSQPLDMSFCKHAVAASQPLIVENAREHPLVKDNKAIANGVVAYAGIPLQTESGESIGALCAIDSKPRKWSDEDVDNLRALARSAMRLIDERTVAHSGEDAPADPSTDILDCAAIHLRALDMYDRLLRSSKSLDFTSEAKARDTVVRSFANLKAAYADIDARGAGSGRAGTELFPEIGKYIDADTVRTETGRQFAEGAVELRELEGAIARHMDAVDMLRLAVMNRGAEL